MSRRIPAKFKAQLGELLADWYRHFGKVAPRRPYHEDDDSGSGPPSNKMFEDHPFLAEMPIGASSDLSSVIIEDERTLNEAKNRSEEMTLELQHKLDLTLGNKLRKRRQYYNEPPQPY